MGVFMNQDNSRIDWIDSWRALLIIMIVVGHTGLRFFTPMFYLYHVGAFFIVSGFTANFSSYQFIDFLKKKAQRLLVPYISINLILVTLIYILQAVGKSNIFFNYVLNPFDWLSIFLLNPTADISGATWFLPVLFFSSIIAFIYYKFSKTEDNPTSSLAIMLAVAIVGLLLSYGMASNKIYLPLNFDLAIIGAFYLTIGYVISRAIGRDYRLKKKDLWIAGIAFLIIVAGYLTKNLMNWPTRAFHLPLADSIQVASGAIIVGLFAMLITKVNFIKKVLGEINKSAIIILGFHFIFFRALYFIYYKLGLVGPEQLKNLVPLFSNPLLLSATSLFAIVLCYLLYLLLSSNRITRRLFVG
jgi:fucose 4-O-acetylase-like acetyltransferase